MKKNPIVTMKIKDRGDVKIELYPQIAPDTVNNFVNLVQKGYYNGLIFHRVIQGFMIQGGDPTGTGTGGPGYHIKGEFTSNGFQNDLQHTPGVISMARSMAPNSAGSQFFIMTSTSPHLDENYAGFGMVIEGLEYVMDVEKVKTDMQDRPKVDEVMESVTVETFGEEYPEPTKY
ncbi:MAG: peptidylprolyl isomerase [Peptostreptococcaceae bacterium]|nr:peptidylprolyl isomerase [Peptostreptococcaceae bacterium]